MSTAAEGAGHERDVLHVDRRWFIPGLVIGWALIVWGALRALDDARDAHPFALLVHVVTFDLFHDLIIAPAVLLIGWAIGKIVPQVARGPVRGAAAFSAIVVVFAYPLLRRWGRRPTNSSTLPLPYARNIAIVVAATWLVAAVLIVFRVVGNRPAAEAAGADADADADADDDATAGPPQSPGA